MGNNKFVLPRSSLTLLVYILCICCCCSIALVECAFVDMRSSYPVYKHRFRACIQGGSYNKEETLQHKVNQNRIVDPGDPEMYVVAIEGSAHPSGTVVVQINKPLKTKILFVLSSDTFVTWNVTIAETVEISSIVLHTHEDEPSELIVHRTMPDGTLSEVTGSIPVSRYCTNEYVCKYPAIVLGGYRWEDGGQKLTTEIGKELNIAYSDYFGVPRAYLIKFTEQLAPCKWISNPENKKQGFASLPKKVKIGTYAATGVLGIAIIAVVISWIVCPNVIRRI